MLKQLLHHCSKFNLFPDFQSAYSSSKELKFSIPQESCSGANIFTCYCALISDIIPDTITTNGFADNHSITKNYKASDKNQEIRTKEELETTVTNIL